MKNAKRKLGILAAVAVAMLAMAGCDDGELGSGADLNIAPAAPMIISFYAEPSSMSAGETTTISWEVAGADEVEISAVASDGSAVSFGVKTDELSGSESVQLNSTTDFVLTATKSADIVELEGEDEEEPAAQHLMGGQIKFGPEEEEDEELPEPSEAPLPAISEVTQTITVTVAPAGRLDARITADASSVAPGESTVIRWSVSPSDDLSAVGVIADSGEAIIATDQCDGTLDDILAQPAMDEFPAVGCAVVAPEVATTYALNAKDNSGNEAQADVTIDVAEGDVSAKIFAAEKDANAQEDNLLMVSSWQNPVVVSWQVSPEAAKVTVTADGSIESSTSAPCELPSEATDKSQGSTECMLSGETTFTITATYGSETDTDEVAVVKAGVSHAALVVPQTWAFVGETMSIEIGLDETTKADSSAIEDVKVNGESITLSSLTDDGKYTASALVTDAGVNVDLYVEGASKPYNYVAVKPVPIAEDELGDGIVRITSHAFAGIDTVYSGVELSGFNDGNMRIYRNQGPIDTDWYDLFSMLSGSPDIMDKAFFEEDSDQRYVSAVAVKGDNPEKVLAASSGIVMYSEANGSDGRPDFEPIMVSPRMVTENYVYDEMGYKTCGCDPVTGSQNRQMYKKAKIDEQVIGLNQTCDMVTNGKYVVVAMDWGVFVDIDLEDGSHVWNGFPPEGGKGSDAGVQKPMFGHVVNDLQKAGEKIFAGADNGVFVSPPTQSSLPATAEHPAETYYGIRWQNFGGLSGPVFALAYDEDNHILYAGNDSGLHYAKVGSGNSTTWDDYEISGYEAFMNPGGTVISIAIDEASGGNTIVVGTTEGIMVTRDRGANWSIVELAGGAQPVEALTIKTESSGSGNKYRFAIGTPKARIVTDPFYVGETAFAGGTIITGVLYGDDDDDSSDDDATPPEDDDDDDQTPPEDEDDETDPVEVENYDLQF